jgi:hypothetical protein
MPGLDESIELAYSAFKSAIETNDLEKAIEMVEPFADKSLYHSSLKSLLIILNAGLTVEKVIIINWVSVWNCKCLFYRKIWKELQKALKKQQNCVIN